MSGDFDLGANSAETDVEPAAAAIGIALSEANNEPSIAADARDFLRKQSRYLELQMEDLHEQRDLTLSHLRWRRFNDWIRAAWESALAVVGIFAIVVLASAVWSAFHAKGLVVRPFKTPPDFATKGLDGTVLAQRLLDKLNGLVVESEPVAFHSADAIRGDWGDDSKVEIPQTGVSVDEMSRSLRAWLGSETHVSGEIWPTRDGIAVTVRADRGAGATVTGREADLDKLLDNAAEKILAETQPYRYAAVLVQRGAFAQAIDYLRPIAHGGAQADRAWAYTFWSNTLVFAGDNRASIPLADMAVRLDPSDPSGYFSRLSAEADLYQAEGTLRDLRAVGRLVTGSRPANLSVPALAVMRQEVPFGVCGLTGDYLCAATEAQQFSNLDFFGFQYGDLLVASNEALAHDGSAARALLESHPQWNDGTAVFYSPAVGDMLPRFFVFANVEQWRLAAMDAAAADRATQGAMGHRDTRHTYVWPWLAYAWARSGNIAGADALIAMTPLDCTPCLQMRGRIADVKNDPASAAYWFARTIADAPSIPFATTDWGAMLLRRGDLDGATAKLALAHKIGPHFADPLEMWGEALMLENRSDLALPKFEIANRYAPKWGRLHLKWGEALGYLGRSIEAHAQYEAASALDLSPGDKAELAKQRAAVKI
ncbi:MAG TPA: hypothetical protein VGG36_05145 [Rhizomicrobium sp.]|jgi:tetratricopeptide (TPR) repeat protein